MGQLDHPNIAKVFDSGVTENGEPYIVMELIQGEPITRFAQERNLDIRGKLELFQAACRGIHHAHLKGIVHRDIKPSNILVREQDGVWIPKVIDFGLAKSHRAIALPYGPWETAYRLGTPGYTSPEQVGGTNAVVDTRSDIYSLGVLLGELLGGGSEDRAAPSRELQAILCKARAENPDHRYQTVAALIEDLERFQKHEPVSAVGSDGIYRLRKFVQRRSLLVATLGGFVVMVLIGGLLLFRESLQIRRAERLAADRLRQGEALIDYLLGDLYGKLDGVGRLDILQGALERVESFYEGAAVEPISAASLAHRAHARRLLGMVLNSRGQTELARTNYYESIKMFDAAIASEPTNTKWLDALSQSWNSLAVSHHSRLEFRDAEAAYLRALEFNARALKISPENANWIDTRASTLHNLAALLEAQNRLDEAEKNYRLALDLWNTLLGREPENSGFLDHAAYAHQNLAFLHAKHGEIEQAAKANEEALRIRELLVERDTNNVQWLGLLADIRQNISDFHLNRNQMELARAFLDAYLPIREQLARRDPSNRSWQEALAKSYQHQAALLTRLGQNEAAARAENRAREISGQDRR